MKICDLFNFNVIRYELLGELTEIEHESDLLSKVVCICI